MVVLPLFAEELSVLWERGGVQPSGCVRCGPCVRGTAASSAKALPPPMRVRRRVIPTRGCPRVRQ